MRLLPALLAIGPSILPVPALAQDAATDESAIRQVIESAYVNGVFVTRDEAAVRAGFHPDFVMAVNDDGQLIVASLDMWLERLGLNGERSSDHVKPTYERIDVTGGTAVVKLELWVNGEHVYTDYLSLYRFSDGWKIVAKVFESQG
jgi:hypothetical protein